MPSQEQELTRLLAPGILGFYTHFEVVEIIAFPNKDAAPINVITIAVAAEGNEAAIPPQPRFLNRDKRITLPSLKDWKFGIYRYSLPISSLAPALGQVESNGEWCASGNPLATGATTPLPSVFVPPANTMEPVPLNHVLKNNFWNGSHVFEWSDHAKSALQPLFQHAPRLQELSQAVQKYLPLNLASLTDRLGNVLVQLPVTVLMSQFTQRPGSNDFVVKLAWHPKAAARPVHANCMQEYDQIISGFMSSEVSAPYTTLAMTGKRGIHQGMVWDPEHQVVLAATGPSSFISTVAFTTHIQHPEPRVFLSKDRNGTIHAQRIQLSGTGIESMVGEPVGDGNGGWTQKRIYDAEVARLARGRVFVQYLPEPGQEAAMHQKALNDLRLLINKHGQTGAWLWDPYLSAQDIINTLFHCPHFSADLRALSSGKEPCTCGAQKPPQTQSRIASFIGQQRQDFQNAQCNRQGLRLEYRVRRAPAGWGFHDRFLIFPSAESKPLAWSLGTSVNSAGMQHHILQQVDNAQLILDAFEKLWNALHEPQYLIWKTP